MTEAEINKACEQVLADYVGKRVTNSTLRHIERELGAALGSTMATANYERDSYIRCIVAMPDGSYVQCGFNAGVGL